MRKLLIAGILAGAAIVALLLATAERPREATGGERFLADDRSARKESRAGAPAIAAHPFPPGSENLEGEAEVARCITGCVVATVVPPSDGSYDLVLERVEDGRWKQDDAYAGRTGNPDRYRFSGLRTGTYRLRDAASDTAGGTIAIPQDGAPIDVILDLSNVVLVDGRIVIHDELQRAGVKVTCDRGRDDAGPSDEPPREPRKVDVDEGGSFRIRASGDRPLTVRGTHPFLRAEPVTIVPSAGAPAVVLEFRVGDCAVLRAGPVAPRWARVVLSLEEPGYGAVAGLDATSDGQTLIFGGFPTGVYTLWIDVGRPSFEWPYAPAVLRQAVLGPGRTDLGTVRFEEGRRLRIRLRGPPSFFEFYHGTVESLAEPHLERSAHGLAIDGSDMIVFRGLAPGSYRLCVGRSAMSRPPSWTKELTVVVGPAPETVIDVDCDR